MKSPITTIAGIGLLLGVALATVIYVAPNIGSQSASVATAADQYGWSTYGSGPYGGALESGGSSGGGDGSSGSSSGGGDGSSGSSSGGGDGSSGGSSGGGGGSSSSNSTETEEDTQVEDTVLEEPAQNQEPTASPVVTSLPPVDLFKSNISFVQPQFNEPTDVRNLEQFLNDFEGETLALNGVYEASDNEAIKRFQMKYRREILDVWNLDEATGYVGITTRLKMNFLLKGQTAQCPVFTEYNGGISTISISPEIQRTKKILADLDMYSGPIDQVWTPQTHEAMIVFQETFREVMLDPWNITEGTGYKYKTTNKFLNYFAGCDTGAIELEGIGVYEGI